MLIGASLRASKRLRATAPRLSAATLGWRGRTTPTLLLMLALLAMFNASSAVALCISCRAAGGISHLDRCASQREPSPDEASDTLDEQEPVYSIIIPLRGEARVCRSVALSDRAAELSAGKNSTSSSQSRQKTTPPARQSLGANHRIPIMVVPVPAVGPATKPKALQCRSFPSLGEIFTVIYDAEDRPERNQLRAALKAFRSAAETSACVQAHLCIDTRTSWLARYFTAEYAGTSMSSFRKLAALGLPLPLGGSSNHFRTATLREVGGWDPHNVTEDADLGTRLARFGYRSGVVASSTYEEAPAVSAAGWASGHDGSKGWMRPPRQGKQIFSLVFKRHETFIDLTSHTTIATYLVSCADVACHVRV
jgi:hypothetical protein